MINHVARKYDDEVQRMPRMPKIYSKKDPCIFLLQFIDGTIRLSHLFCCINSASNFVIYYFNGTKFRQAWCEIYGSPFHYCVHPSENSNNLFRSENVPTVQNILRAGKYQISSFLAMEAFSTSHEEMSSMYM